MKPLRFRQIHLDFHTSEKIENIGLNFDPIKFQEALKIGHINSITLFSKGHHGWAYHPTSANKEHPHLSFDLLKAQITAAHEIGVNTPVYISAGLDEKITRLHPEWLYRNKDESTTWASDYNQAGYHMFCLNSPYLDVLLNQIDEVVQNYDADGIFLDIVAPRLCYCQTCVNQLLEEGKDPYNVEIATELGERVYKNYTSKVRETIDQYKPGLPVFHNAGHLSKGRVDLAHMNTHLEIESLPTGGWGYDHFPLSAKYFINHDQDFLGMTGKFHTMWGEFGGFKHPNALLYETSLTLAMGGKCSIGDQLHPLGEMDLATYKLVGKAYSYIEQIEDWCGDVKNMADIAILSAEAMDSNHVVDRDVTYPMDIGANRMLLQSHYLYDIVDGNADFSAYKILILPDSIKSNEVLTKKLEDFVGSGGKLLVSGTSLLDESNHNFEIDLGLTWKEHNTNTPNFYRPNDKCGFETPTSLVMYSDSEIVDVTDGVSLGALEDSYFNRSTFYFCSHQHTPSTNEFRSPGMVATDSTVYIPWKIFSEFAGIASLHLREMVSYAIDYLLGDKKTLEINLPSQGLISYMQQPKENRNILHLLYGSPVLRGYSSVTQKPIEVIEDLIPINNTKVTIQVERPITRVYLAPQMIELTYTKEADSITFMVDTFTCHQMIVIE